MAEAEAMKLLVDMKCWHCRTGHHDECWGNCSCLECAGEDKDEFDVRDAPMKDARA